MSSHSYFDRHQENHRFPWVKRELNYEDWDNYWGFIRFGSRDAKALVEFDTAVGGGETSVGRPGVTILSPAPAPCRGRETGAKDILVVIFLLIYDDKARLKFHLSKIVPCRTAGAGTGAGASPGPESEAKTCFESQ